MRTLRLFVSLSVGLFIASGAVAQTKKPVEKSVCPPEYRETLTSEECKSVKVWVGMSIEQLRKNWGLPDHVNSTLSKGGTSYQLVYEHKDSVDRDFVYVSDGRVTTVQLEYSFSKRLYDLNLTKMKKDALASCFANATTQEGKVACVTGPRKQVN